MKFNCEFLFVLFVTYTIKVALSMDNKIIKLNSPDSLLYFEESSEKVTQLCFNSSGKFCKDKLRQVCYIICSDGEPQLKVGYCATYSEETRLISMTTCPNLQHKGYNVTSNGYIRLPRNLSQLNHYMCTPLNRKGFVCSECVDGFGPSLNYLDYKCANCTNIWYGVLLLLSLECVPITILFLIILVFRISVTSPPMPCFIMYAQLVDVFFRAIIHNNVKLKEIVSNKDGDLSLVFKIIQTFYSSLNLHFFRTVLPPICISSHLKNIYISLFGYTSVLYPLVLIFLTWLCVELHGRNVQPLVWLWRPFHRCFVRLRRGWDTKSDIIDVFITFFILSYSKCVYQSVLYLGNQTIINFDELGKFVRLSYRHTADLTVDYSNKTQYLFSILAVILFILFCILPPIFLTLYSFKISRLCINKCHLNNIIMNTFVEKFHSSYREGLGGGRDMRCFSGLYFFLRFIICFFVYLSEKLSDHRYFIMLESDNEIWFILGSVLLTVTLIVALCRPYKKNYMNVIDSLFLANIVIQVSVISSSFHTKTMLTISLLAPIVVLALILTIKLTKTSIETLSVRQCLNGLKLAHSRLHRSERRFEEGETTEQQPLIQPS